MKEIMLGNKAVARGAYEAGVKVVSSYPGTPSTEITEFVSEYDEVYAQWSPNEKVALEVAFGAAMSGERAMACMKHVGLNVAADPLFTAAYAGVNGGLVVAVADDPGMHSSQNEQDSRYYAKSAHLPMLEPSDSNEALIFTKLAFDLSEQYDTPVIVRMTTRTSHSQSICELSERQEHSKPYKKDIDKYVMMPAKARPKHVLVENRENKMKLDSSGMDINHIEYKDKEIGIITSGVAYQYVSEAMPSVSVLKLGMVYPLPEKLIKEFCANVDKIYVIEELEPFLWENINAMGVKIEPRNTSVQGELSVIKVKHAFGVETDENESVKDLPIRPPVMCPGCPHRGLFHILQKNKVTVCGDIGCYTLGALAPYMAMDAVLCMGASVSMNLGMEKAKGMDFAKKTVSVIGDSTFFHSGITGLVDMVYNDGHGTVIVLDNSTTGMTGHQPNPSTGKNAKGEVATVVDIEQVCRGVGVKNVVTVDPFDLKELDRVLKEELAREEVSVIITRRPCALIIKDDPVYHIDQDKCTKCKACYRLGCPAISVVDEVVSIDESLCTGCGLCVKTCNFGAIKREGE